jgi:cytidine deaminase
MTDSARSHPVPLSDDQLLARADAVAARAYAPYSGFHVGCAVLTRDGRVIEGVNVENAAYPLGVCAERTAFSRAVVEGYRPGDFVVAAINASPCGGCRQWLAEMGVERVVFRNGDRIVRMTVDELLPEQFEKSNLS